jgi:Tol biopolymer transport system component
VPNSSADLWAVPLAEPHTPFLVRQTPFGEGAPARFSPDGRWVAYWSDESGRSEVYVTQFQGTTERVQVSSTGGDWPRWSADGRELFYLALDDWLMGVPVSREGQSLAFGAPKRLFQVHARNESGSATRYPYDVAPDGRILINALQETSHAETVTLLVNWPAAVHR